MPERPASAALLAALDAPRRNALALAAVTACFAVAAGVGSRPAYYAAALAAFCVWMAWFVATVIDWIDRADF